MLRPTILAAVVALAAAWLAAPRAEAAPGVRFGVKDDAWLVYGPGRLDSRLDQLDRAGVDLVRVTLRWDDIARRQPENGRNPSDPAYRWGAIGHVITRLGARDIDVVATLVGTPAWANGGRTREWAPMKRSWFADFAYAAARRYPLVHYWTIWNEPNQRLWLRPTAPRVYVELLLNPAYAAIKQASPTALVAGGVTAPRGNAGGVSPLAWVQGMGEAGAKLDAYAHHPYPLSPQTETPRRGSCGHCETITMATLEKLITSVRRWLGPKRIWLTEYGYQTDPPDAWLGVSWALQALYVAEAGLRAWRAPSVDMLINFMFRDDAPDSPGVHTGWQSGFFTTSGGEKPSLRAFMLPLAQVTRIEKTTTVWGQVRPRRGPQAYRVQTFQDGRWEWLGTMRQTGATGTYVARVNARTGTRVRVWSPSDELFSLALKVR
jgi:hypothetical protein